ncbi:hypothetical protein CDL15_Pgr026065 [Punica granatum]|uniref:Uncharacterized protein n=1 Tax=Punica granatum TaxID=22663 RepID=A0A218WBN8_PUNGR|nr:hypothetical protein CDL15_Pgr026065 [Punica granatum]
MSEQLERARGRGLNSRRFEGRRVEVTALRSRGRAGFEVDVVFEVGERARVEVRGVAVTGVRGRRVERQEAGAGQEAGPQKQTEQ